MDLPKYKHLTISSYAPEELENFLQKEINLNAPTAIDLKKLTIDQQKEIIV